MTPFAERLSLLRVALKENGIGYYMIPSSDPHLGEYVPDHWRIVAWLTGFTGSAATLIISDSFAGLWTDSRYFVQAENQLEGSGFDLMKSVQPDRLDYINWLADNVKTGSKTGLDGKTFSIGLMRRIEKCLEGKNITIDSNCDLISEIWTDRPPMPVSVAFDHPVSFCGKGRDEKIKEVRDRMKRDNLKWHLLTSVDDIMWLLNIRGYDIKYSPVIISFAIIGEEQILLFTDEAKIPLRLASDFDKSGIVILPYEEAAGMLSTLSAASTILITTETTSVSLFSAIPDGMKIKEDISIPTHLKAIKNSIEIENIRKAMIKDGVALTKLFYWIENNAGSVPMSELSLSEKLNGLKSGLENYIGPSFQTIIGYNDHAALPHYIPTKETDCVIGQTGILLIDSGGQYLDGTTDITRTIALGVPTAMQKKDFTLVLRGTINLAMAKFPYGTRGYQLDLLARRALWECGMNYGHGTGHGVGFCLNVHEGPQNISQSASSGSKTNIEPGMLISDEPGIYRVGEYGIRTENLILGYEDEETEFGKFLKFDTVSLCYIDKSLIDVTLLEQGEIDWLNAYHSEVYDKLSPYLTDAEKIWLEEKTEVL